MNTSLSNNPFLMSMYVDDAVELSDVMARHNAFVQEQLEESRRQRELYFGFLEQQQEESRRAAEYMRQQILRQTHGPQVAEPVMREAEAYVVQEADVEVEECSGCSQGQANQMAHMDPGGCLYEDEEEIPGPSELTREETSYVFRKDEDEDEDEDEVIVLNGENIVCG